MTANTSASNAPIANPMILVDTSVLLEDPAVLTRISANNGLPFITGTILSELAVNQTNPDGAVACNAQLIQRELASGSVIDLIALPNGRAPEAGDSLRRLTFKGCPVYVVERMRYASDADGTANVIAIARSYGMRLLTRVASTKVVAEREGVAADLWTGPRSDEPNTMYVEPRSRKSPATALDGKPALAEQDTRAKSIDFHRNTTQTISRTSLLSVAVVVILLVSVALWIFRPVPSIEVQYAPGEETLVMRTKGGTLGVSEIRSVQTFTKTKDHKIVWIPLGQTVSQIRVPAYFRYYIELAPEWPVTRRGEVFTVVAPEIKPALPVAVDLALIEKDVSGTWSLITGAGALDELEKSITATLGERAALPRNIELQREPARRTVEEFVRKWLIAQKKQISPEKQQIRVLFVGESGS
ncbi:MAG: hypothetical protein NT024_00515 [Proteobacteria bacterium]|nr:hypothetical protein [Pseudomonadota bacterium]